MLPEFDRNWASMGLNDNDLRRLQEELLFNPEKGDVMQGTAVCESCGSRLRAKAKAAVFAFVMWISQFMRAFISLPHILRVKRII